MVQAAIRVPLTQQDLLLSEEDCPINYISCETQINAVIFEQDIVTFLYLLFGLRPSSKTLLISFVDMNGAPDPSFRQMSVKKRGNFFIPICN